MNAVKKETGKERIAQAKSPTRYQKNRIIDLGNRLGYSFDYLEKKIQDSVYTDAKKIIADFEFQIVQNFHQKQNAKNIFSLPYPDERKRVQDLSQKLGYDLNSLSKQSFNKEFRKLSRDHIHALIRTLSTELKKFQGQENSDKRI